MNERHALIGLHNSHSFSSFSKNHPFLISILPPHFFSFFRVLRPVVFTLRKTILKTKELYKSMIQNIKNVLLIMSSHNIFSNMIFFNSLYSFNLVHDHCLNLVV